MRASVFDCNVFVQAVASPGTAYRCLAHVLHGPDRLLVSKYILDEARYVLSMPWLQARLPGITPKRVEALFHHLRLSAVYVENVPKLFDFPPDPDDAPYLDLALYASAFALVTRDKAVLRLNDRTCELGMSLRERHPSLHLVVPEVFQDLCGAKPGVSELLHRRTQRRGS